VGKGRRRAFEVSKKKINEALVLELPNMQYPFKVEMYACGHAMGVVFMLIN